MRININNINLNNLTSALIDSFNDDDDADNVNNVLFIDFNITEQDLNDFNERIVNPSSINSIMKLCVFLAIDFKEIEQLIINNIIPTSDKYILDDINKHDCKNLLFLENITIYDILKHDMIEWLKFKFNEYDKETLCEKSAQKGAIKCLKYSHENGCPWNKNTCKYAAGIGNIECLNMHIKMDVNGMKIHVLMLHGKDILNV
jgi:hypothetical protein